VGCRNGILVLAIHNIVSKKAGNKLRRLCVVVDGLNGLVATQKSKIFRLLPNFEEVVFVINAYNPYFERFYFYKNQEFSVARQIYSAKLSNIRSEIRDSFSTGDVPINIVENSNKNIAAYLIPILNEHEESVLILSTANLTNRHTVHLAIIKSIHQPILMLTNRGWPKKPLVVSAVDPVHHMDESGLIDVKIISQGRTLAAQFNSTFKIVHSRYIPSLLQDFSAEIHAAHLQAIEQLSDNNKNLDINVDLIGGNPERTIPNYIGSNGGDVLVVGSIARSASKHRFVGSTSESLMQKMPCDILFVNSDSSDSFVTNLA